MRTLRHHGGEREAVLAGYLPDRAAVRRRAVILSAVTAALLVGGSGCAGPVTGHSSQPPGPAASGSTGPSPPRPGASSPAGTQVRGALAGLSCTSTSDCLAVGDLPHGYAAPVSYSERWDGSAWSAAGEPGPPGNHDGSGLLGVSCVSAGDCWAVGLAGNLAVTPYGPPYIAHWDGTGWSSDRVPFPPGADPGFAHLGGGLSCTSARDCWAVGWAGIMAGGGLTRLVPLTEHWDGRGWSVVPTPVVSRQSGLVSVSCAAGGDCWAVGNWVSDPQGRSGGTLTEHWNGSAWSVVPNPTDRSGPVGSVAGQPVAADKPGAEMFADSCASAAMCLAVGTAPGNLALAERWNGSAWALTSVATPAGAGMSLLQAVSCPTSSWCMAVGSFNRRLSQTPGEGPSRVLAERWDGSAWTIVPTPSPADTPTLGAVSCTSPQDCWAAGSSGGALQPSFLEHWNGQSWSVIS